MIKLKDIVEKQEALAPGHRGCPGCALPIATRMIFHAIDDPVVVSTATGCLQTITSIYPYSSWRVPWFHSAFENAATGIECIAAAYRALVKQGKMEEKNIQFIALGGDGASYDIGFQFLSGAVERGRKFLYVCLNNEAYMNTGIQRSSATPLGAWTTTSQVGAAVPGKPQWRKDLTGIMAAHNMGYVAQTAVHAWRDLMTKVQKALLVDGPTFINVLSPCPRGWRYKTEDTIRISRLAAETCIWPLYEVEDGAWKLNYEPKEKKALGAWLEPQGRFRHLLRPENTGILQQLQEHVDREWRSLVEKSKKEERT